MELLAGILLLAVVALFIGIALAAGVFLVHRQVERRIEQIGKL